MTYASWSGETPRSGFSARLPPRSAPRPRPRSPPRRRRRPGAPPRSDACVTSTGTAASASMYASRSAGYARVQRHVRAARLEHGQDGDDHLRPALQADPHPRLRPDAETARGGAPAGWPARSAPRTSATRVLVDHAPRRPACAPPAPRTARGCTASAGYSASVRFHSSSTCRALGLREHLDVSQRPLRRRLQRLDQPRQRRVHHRAHPLRAHRRPPPAPPARTRRPRSFTERSTRVVRPLHARGCSAPAGAAEPSPPPIAPPPPCR